MKKILSLPPNLVECFHDITGLGRKDWFCGCDPVGHRLGSGGGTAHLLLSLYRQEAGEAVSFRDWLGRERRIIIHAGGQGRRLPAYSPSGKVLTPVPVFRWERGQKLSQTLLDLQLPLLTDIMEGAPKGQNTLIASGDVYIRCTEALPPMPEADVVCYGLWLDASIATHHGVFVSSLSDPSRLEYMLQKPSEAELAALGGEHFYLTDIGLWVLSDRAVEVLMRRSTGADGLREYNLYSEFGCALGSRPTIADQEVSALTTAIVPLSGGEFYHFGTSSDLLSSTVAIQSIVSDQRRILQHSRKPNPAIFIQNADVRIPVSSSNRNVWIENCIIPAGWTITCRNILTGIPDNDWRLQMAPGQCLDIVPVGAKSYAVRPYGFTDPFCGPLTGPAAATFLGRPFTEWASERGIEPSEIDGADDLQSAALFPLLDNPDDAGCVARWMLSDPSDSRGRALWRGAERLSADDLGDRANLRRLTAQRDELRLACLPLLAANYRHSVFYQLDLDDTAREYARTDYTPPSPLPDDEPVMMRLGNAMFRARVAACRGDDGTADRERAFALMRETLTGELRPESPHLAVCTDQIVWSRSPVRIDIAGGWTDTPPYCLAEGGEVINLAVELGGQPPLQVYVKPCRERHIVIRSIDLGAAEEVHSYEQLADFRHVGSPFSIPKAAIALAGFLPQFSAERFPSLRDQLEHFGAGLELTLLSAVPAGSGLGTSSILSATVLGALSNFCGLGWDKDEIGLHTLILEQILTTGGGWQDQFGGILHGVKLLETEPGYVQRPVTRFLPTDLWTSPEYAPCHLLYYTGITRTAKNILSEIVERMFLSDGPQLRLLRHMKSHVSDMYDAIQRANFRAMGELVRRTWEQNCRLDSGTNPPEIEALTRRIDDLCLGYKLPGAGGGGFLYMIAKDPDAAAAIITRLNASPLRPNARFVQMRLSTGGLQTSRS